MKTSRCSLAAILAITTLSSPVLAQTTAGTAASAPAVATARTNTAIVPVERSDEGGRNRTQEVLKRAKDNQGACDVAFIGDSITQGWEGNGKNVWEKYYGNRKCLNLGVGGDRTQHVLWRFENGQLDGIKPKAAVLMIGTNNSNRDDNTEGEILEGVTAIVKQIRTRLPETKIVLVGIFPRGQTFSTQRGKILQVNQALAKLANSKSIYYVDIGSKLIEKDGSISKEIMPDYLHLSEKGYGIWAARLETAFKSVIDGSATK
jgi:Lysophospholipase L1 and related esterases